MRIVATDSETGVMFESETVTFDAVRTAARVWSMMFGGTYLTGSATHREEFKVALEFLSVPNVSLILDSLDLLAI